MYQLTSSGKSPAQIQKEWHAYYADLPDNEKHEVWQEFYASDNRPVRAQPKVQPASSTYELPAIWPREDQKPAVQSVTIEPYLDTPTLNAPKHTAKPTVPSHKPKNQTHRRKNSTKTVADVKKQILGNVKTGRKLKAHQHFQSFFFGLGIGSLVLVLLLFGFFNERFIAPFITPSRHVSSTPIIIDPNSAAVSPNPEVLIPKINVEIPVIYDQASINEDAMQSALERGVVHYATTPLPGQKGNTVIFGHSSNNIFNPGKYKFAFVLLNRLDNGDLFYLTQGGKQYVYRVYKKTIVQPTDVQVLNPTEKPATATLITCDPPGTSLHRLVVVGEQITPDPSGNSASTAAANKQTPTELPSNSPSLWQRFTGWISG
jgi:sortase A